jgi:hypothetical protein
MKKNKIFGLLTAGLALGFVACNDSSDKTGTATDSLGTNTDNTATVTDNTTVDYSAFADSVERNSQSGYYLNARTGKPQKLKVNRTSGEITDESTGEPVWRYVDNRNWWVYGLDDSDWSWDTRGEAKLQGDKLVYKGDGDKWVEYDDQWKMEDETITKGWKDKSNGVKIKVGKDGDIKIKDKSGTVKYDADDNKIKTDSSHK